MWLQCLSGWKVKWPGVYQLQEPHNRTSGKTSCKFPVKIGEPLTVCNVCLSAWGPGLEHVCSRQVKQSNIQELVRSTSQKSKGNIVSSQIKEICVEQGVPTLGGTVTLTTGGPPLPVTLENIERNLLQSFQMRT